MSGYQHSASVFIGETSRGTPQPVFFDTHTQIFNNKPPGIVVTGEPGSGKTFFLTTEAAISTIFGKSTVAIDPKGDFLSLSNLEKDIGKVNIWDMASRNAKGLLDPFRMTSEPSEQLDLAFTIIEIFTGGLTGDERTALAPILKDIRNNPNPSLGQVVQELRGSQRQSARNLGTTLSLISDLPFANLCFAQSGSKLSSVSLGAGLTVVTLTGMDMPKEGAQDNKSRLSTGILFLVTDFVRRLMMQQEATQPKTLIIDEAWALLQVNAGAEMIKSVALLGRSKNLALFLATQNNSHLKNLDIDSTIATRFAFASSAKEAKDLIEAMGLPQEEGLEDIITSLGRGECLMQDFTGRYSTVQISNWNKEWADAFKTNPYEKAIKEKEKQKQ